MKNLFGWLMRPIVPISGALLIFCVLVWWIGPLVKIGAWEPLATEWARVLLIVLVLLAVLLRWLLRRWRARRASQKLTDGLVRSAQTPTASAPSENPEQKVLGERFAEAVATLKKMRLTAAGHKPGLRDWLSLSGGSYLYELPWYLFIGAPGAGKTTALVNSGLEFPLAEKFGAGAIRGIGGTRNCDWWFTDQAVLIDTAGRYTTQDSHAQEDKGAWEGFLGLLKKARPRRPLNGVFLTVSVADLLAQNVEQRSALAAALRARLLELDGKLATRLPVYVLVTKVDLLYGFVDYFADFGKEQRAQVFGFTLPSAESARIAEQGLGAAFQREFGLLRQRLNNGLVERMQQESDGTRRGAIFGFPAQFGALAPALGELLDQVFTGSRFAQPPWVRGVYFTSGTQEGSPIDRVMGSLARSFGLERALLPTQQGSGRSYFLSTLLREVVFPEALIAGADLKLERRRHTLRLAALAAMALASVGLLGAWAYSLMRNLDYLQSVEARIGPVRDTLAAVTPTRSGAITQVAQQLQALGNLWRTPVNRDGNAPLSMTLGLYQGDKLYAATALAHQRALNEVFLPQLDRRLDEQLRTASRDNLEYSYEALKSYLMLHQSEHFNADALNAWITLDWERSLDRGISQEERAALEQQLDVLLAQGPPRAALPMDENLVRNVRALLASYPLEARIFSRLQRLRVGSDIPAFNIAQAAGPSAPLVFERASGKPLTEGIPGLFTVEGYRQRFQSEAVRLSGVMALEEPWVLGLNHNLASQIQDVAMLDALTDRVRRLYLQAYVKQWDVLLADVQLVRGGNLERHIEVARILSGANSPLTSYLRAVVKETTLIPPEGDKNVVSKAADTVRSTRKGLENLLGADTARSTAPGRPIEAIVDDHFALLHQFAQGAGQGQPAPLDDVLKLFNEVYVYLTAVDTAARSRGAPPPGDSAGRLKADAGRLPEPVRGMVENLSQSGAVQAQAAERGNLSQDLRPIAEFCQRAIAGRYPLVPASTRDVLPDDFGQFFGPGGMMDDFFQKRLASLVDTSTRPWRYKPVADGPALATAALAQFGRAARIRDIFFRGGGRGPSIRLDFKPVEMDAGITQFTLDVDGQLVKYAHGPVVPMTVQWPGPKGSNQVRVEINPPSPTGASGMSVDGPWALFRVLDKAQFQEAGVPERFFVTFDIEHRRTRFEVTANSVQHPIHLRELREFACPEGL
jgi:type VI secretion system protein ImpL